jgi:hypothetical protein
LFRACWPVFGARCLLGSLWMGAVWPTEDRCNVEAYLSSKCYIDSDRQVSTSRRLLTPVSSN